MSETTAADLDWPVLVVGLGWMALVSIGSTLAVVHGRWDLAAAFLTGVVSTGGVLVFFGTRS